MAKNKARGTTQFAALPWRIADSGAREVMLLTSRETRRWVIPKGWPMKRLKPHEVAAREAYEEAGLVGHVIGKRPIGAYHYQKRLPRDRLLCEVLVFSLRVDGQLDDWPEKAQRETRWFGLSEAASLVDEGGLAEVIQAAFIGKSALPGLRKRKRACMPNPLLVLGT
jgi:8-oxo-dGTP pyrophosphatase MutT (NUDIX family)